MGDEVSVRRGDRGEELTQVTIHRNQMKHLVEILIRSNYKIYKKHKTRKKSENINEKEEKRKRRKICMKSKKKKKKQNVNEKHQKIGTLKIFRKRS